eukprot:TRINITY_DN59727_c0_g1_i1.p1 TRINITY_DN59727_c0_g1~~TRINITY_DN59727_c0_g1_i1.p1  ORF type:complete len:550 (+),score=133.47 TRINITY_DN59727_c0_g1_i1:126-1775(+)
MATTRSTWEADGPLGWVVALGRMKECEVNRQQSFKDWIEQARMVLAVEQRRAGSAQLLLDAITAQVNDRAVSDEDYAKRLAKAAKMRDAAEFSTAKKTVQWIEEDRLDAGYLTDMHKAFAGYVEEGAKAFRQVVQKSDAMQKLRAIGTESIKKIAEAEIALKVAEAKDAECCALWRKHEKFCRQRLVPANGKTTNTSDLWTSESAYRKAARAFEVEVHACHVTLQALRAGFEGAASQHRSIARQVLRTVMACMAAYYSGLAQMLTPAEGGMALPHLPGLQYSHLVAPPLPPAQPPLEVWEPMPLPATSFSLRSGAVELPPKALSIFGSWRAAFLLLSSDGHVHCFESAADVDCKSPSWSTEPGPGCSLTVNEDTRTLTLQKARGWLFNGSPDVVRIGTADELAMWQLALRRWWPPPGDASSAGGYLGDHPPPPPVAGDCADTEAAAASAAAPPVPHHVPPPPPEAHSCTASNAAAPVAQPGATSSAAPTPDRQISCGRDIDTGQAAAPPEVKEPGNTADATYSTSISSETGAEAATTTPDESPQHYVFE